MFRMLANGRAPGKPVAVRDDAGRTSGRRRHLRHPRTGCASIRAYPAGLPLWFFPPSRVAGTGGPLKKSARFFWLVGEIGAQDLQAGYDGLKHAAAMGLPCIRTRTDKKNVQIGIQLWLDEDGSTIRVSSNARPDFNVRLKPDPLKRNGHPSLYRRLAWLLRDAGMPAPT